MPDIPNWNDVYKPVESKQVEYSQQDWERSIASLPRSDVRKQRAIGAQIRQEAIDFEKLWKGDLQQ